jgi:hypothetical protein
LCSKDLRDDERIIGTFATPSGYANQAVFAGESIIAKQTCSWASRPLDDEIRLSAGSFDPLKTVRRATPRARALTVIAAPNASAKPNAGFHARGEPSSHEYFVGFCGYFLTKFSAHPRGGFHPGRAFSRKARVATEPAGNHLPV